MTKTSKEWAEIYKKRGLLILDPDGWPRHDPYEFDKFWNYEMITEREFMNRVKDSTIQCKLGKL